VEWWFEGVRHVVQGNTPQALTVVQLWITRNSADPASVEMSAEPVDVGPLPPADEPITVVAHLEGGHGNSQPFFVPDDVRVWRIRWASAGDSYPLIHLRTTAGDPCGSMGSDKELAGVSYFYDPGRYYLECNINGKWQAQVEVVERAGAVPQGTSVGGPAVDSAQANLFRQITRQDGEGPIQITLPNGARRPDGSVSTLAEVHPLEFAQLSSLVLGANPTRFSIELLMMTVSAIGGVVPSREVLRSLIVGDIQSLVVATRRATLGSYVVLNVSCECGQEYQHEMDLRTLPPQEFTHEGALTLPSGRRQNWKWPTAAWAEAWWDKAGSAQEVIDSLALESTLLDDAGAPVTADYVRQLSPADRVFLLDCLSGGPGPDLSIRVTCPACREEFNDSLTLAALFPWPAIGLDGWAVESDSPGQLPAEPSVDGHVPVDAQSEVGQLPLDSLVGLASVKRDIAQLTSFQQIQAERRAAGLPVQSVGRHLVFEGNPGTGKTTVARLLGRIYADLGLLKNGRVEECSRSELVGTHLGETAAKVTAVVQKALGGILFIDEAYSLTPRTDGGGGDPYCTEAIDTLVKLMEDHRDDLIVIVAGYTDRMEEFLDANPGLKSRFDRKLLFDDYTPTELLAIFDGMCSEARLVMTAEASAELRRHLTTMTRPDSFGNGRYVRSLFEQTLVRQSERLASNADRRADDLSTLEVDDLALPNARVAVSSDDLSDALAELDSLVGLGALKREVSNLVDTLKIQRLRQESGLPVVSSSQHLVFAGNPGTGKTTVARVLARIYCALGFVSRGNIIECARADLVAGYVGQTAMKTTRKVKEALGGVLFIDEAYTLARDIGSTVSFGGEAIDTLLKLMEDYRDDLVVIAAGYSDEMEGFINANPGLQSRFTDTLEFPDYTDEELSAIFQGMAQSAGIALRQEVKSLIDEACAALRNRPDFANARSVRTLFQRVMSAQAVRLAVGTPTLEELSEILPTDVMRATVPDARMDS
jgi:SpoVK/Ycf46/Vps4 family AAA+-type ATPase